MAETALILLNANLGKGYKLKVFNTAVEYNAYTSFKLSYVPFLHACGLW